MDSQRRAIEINRLLLFDLNNSTCDDDYIILKCSLKNLNELNIRR